MLTPADRSLELTISIVSYNVRWLLAECLDSIVACTKGISYEIVVVDNGSDDGTLEMLRQSYPRVRVIANQRNLGFAAAQNIGLRSGRGRYLYALDSDTYIKADTFTAMVRFMDEHPEAGAAGARLLSPDGTRQYSRRNFPPSLWPIIYRGTFLKRILPSSRSVTYYEMSDWVFDVPKEVDWLYGGNIILRRQAIREIGLFDERFFMYFEEVDICRRAWMGHWRVVYDPAARFTHYHQRESRIVWPWELLWNRPARAHIASAVYYFWKYRGAKHPHAHGKPVLS